MLAQAAPAQRAGETFDPWTFWQGRSMRGLSFCGVMVGFRRGTDFVRVFNLGIRSDRPGTHLSIYRRGWAFPSGRRIATNLVLGPNYTLGIIAAGDGQELSATIAPADEGQLFSALVASEQLIVRFDARNEPAWHIPVADAGPAFADLFRCAPQLAPAVPQGGVQPQ